MKFFFDNNLSEHLVRGLREFDENVVHLKEKFRENTEDPEWLEYVGKNNMVLLSRDKRLRWNPAEIESIRQFNVGAFVLSGKNLNRCQIIQQIIRNWPQIKEIATKSRNKVPYIYRVPPRGTKIEKYNL